MRIVFAIFLFGATIVAQVENPTDMETDAAYRTASEGELFARFTGTDNRVSLCVKGSGVSVRCYHSVQTTNIEGHRYVVHSAPVDYIVGEIDLIGIHAAERDWVDGQ